MKSCLKQYHYLYKITNLINNKIYIGVHSTNNLDDDYFGSGILLNTSIKKYGKENFRKDILEWFDWKCEAYARETVIVTSEFIKHANNYNICIGGHGSSKPGFKMMITDNDRLRRKNRAKSLYKFQTENSHHKQSMSLINSGKVFGFNNPRARIVYFDGINIGYIALAYKHLISSNVINCAWSTFYAMINKNFKSDINLTSEIIHQWRISLNFNRIRNGYDKSMKVNNG